MGKLRLRNLYKLIVFVATLRRRVGPASPMQQLRTQPHPHPHPFPGIPPASLSHQSCPSPFHSRWDAQISPETEQDCSSQVTQHLPAPTHAGTPGRGRGEPQPPSSGTGCPGLVWVKLGQQGWLPPQERQPGLGHRPQDGRNSSHNLRPGAGGGRRGEGSRP